MYTTELQQALDTWDKTVKLGDVHQDWCEGIEVRKLVIPDGHPWSDHQLVACLDGDIDGRRNVKIIDCTQSSQHDVLQTIQTVPKNGQ